MIVVEKAEKFRICNVCCKSNDIYTIIFRYEGTNTGTQIALCNKCVANLVETLLPYIERREE